MIPRYFFQNKDKKLNKYRNIFPKHIGINSTDIIPEMMKDILSQFDPSIISINDAKVTTTQ
jgi:hypothetical protein